MADYASLVRRALTAAGLGGAGAAASSDDAEAAFLGRMARGANLKQLERAQQMRKQFKSDQEIIGETGWFQGPDKQWRYEISDLPATFSASRLPDVPRDVMFRNLPYDIDEAVRSARTPISDALKHPELYRAYPELREIRAMQFPSRISPSTSAFVDESTAAQPVIGLSTKLSPLAARSSALHELQHRIQTIEGFAPGGGLATPQVVEEAARKAGMPGASYMDLMEMPGGRGKLYDEYKRLAGEVEARNVQARADWPMSVLREKEPWRTQDVLSADTIVLPPEPYQFRLPFPDKRKKR